MMRVEYDDDDDGIYDGECVNMRAHINTLFI